MILSKLRNYVQVQKQEEESILKIATETAPTEKEKAGGEKDANQKSVSERKESAPSQTSQSDKDKQKLSSGQQQKADLVAEKEALIKELNQQEKKNKEMVEKLMQSQLQLRKVKKSVSPTSKLETMQEEEDESSDRTATQEKKETGPLEEEKSGPQKPIDYLAVYHHFNIHLEIIL